MRGMNAATGEPLAGLEHLRQSITDILTTRIGERVMRRDYGSNLPNLVDAPTNGELAIELYVATAEALDRWEPRIKVRRVQVTAAEPGRVTLQIDALYLPEGREVTLDGLVIE